MAYATSNPPRLISQSVGAGTTPAASTDGGKHWLYIDADPLATVLAAGYFTDGHDLGMRLNDKVTVVDTALGQTKDCVVSLSTSGGAVSVAFREASSVVATTAVTTLTADQSGSTITLGAAGGYAVTLPAPAVGLKFKFIVLVAPTTAYTVVTTASANIIHGQISSAEDAAGSVSTAASSDTISFVANKAIIGDYCEVESDGTNWYVSGMCNVQDGITTTQAS